MEDQIRELYRSGKGLKAISKELDIPAATIRRRLIAMNVYEGVAHGASHEEETASEESEPEIKIESPNLNLDLWMPRGDISVKRDRGGWLINLGSGFDASLVSPPLEGEWTGRGIEVCADMRLISPSFGSICLGIRNENMLQGDEGSCLLQAGFVPSRYHVRHLCQGEPQIYFKSNSYSPVSIIVAGLEAREISSAGLKPIVLPEKKKLETGERIDLAHLWQADGCNVMPCPWSPGALEVDFLNLTSSIYAPLIPETLNRKIKLILKMRSLSGSFSLDAALGDDAGEATQEGLISREPCTWELERNVEKNGYVRILGKTYGREKIVLEESFVVA